MLIRDDAGACEDVESEVAAAFGPVVVLLARTAAHQGTLVCDIDELRSWVSGWEDDFVGTGEAVRQTALALKTAYLRTGRDVVLPQLIVTPSQTERFEAAAAEGKRRTPVSSSTWRPTSSWIGYTTAPKRPSPR